MKNNFSIYFTFFLNIVLVACKSCAFNIIKILLILLVVNFFLRLTSFCSTKQIHLQSGFLIASVISLYLFKKSFTKPNLISESIKALEIKIFKVFELVFATNTILSFFSRSLSFFLLSYTF